MRRRAHQFGFGGHCFTKSRRFSTTFKALREARAAHAAGRSPDGGMAPAKSDHNLIETRAWSFAGRGYRKAGDALLADSSHARAREHRRLAREGAMDEASRANHKHGLERQSPHSAPQSRTRADGARGTRTPDLLGAIQALSQLSYSPEQGGRNREPAVQGRIVAG